MHRHTCIYVIKEIAVGGAVLLAPQIEPNSSPISYLQSIIYAQLSPHLICIKILLNRPIAVNITKKFAAIKIALQNSFNAPHFQKCRAIFTCTYN